MIDVFHLFAFLQDAAAMVALESARQGQAIKMAALWGVPRPTDKPMILPVSRDVLRRRYPS